MCGICGIFSITGSPVSGKEIGQMISVIRHRGPDDEGMFFKDNAGLGHLRLSIIDLSKAGHQPMFDKSGRYCIVHNGEVYNYPELKEDLKNKYSFISMTDTEVILYSYIEWGIKCLERFTGMFAFAIYDTYKSELFIARDRFGIKPLYYHMDKDRFIFASETKSILSVMPQEKKPNDEVIFDYLVYNRTDQCAETFFKNIRRLEHGHYALVSKEGVELHQWYDLSKKLQVPFISAEELKNMLLDSMKLHLRSDVPVGVCLSGGLDSSSIVSILTNVMQKKDLHTFSAVYAESDKCDESKYINLYSDSVLKMHKARPSAEEFLADIWDFMECHNEPLLGTSPYAQFKVMQSAKSSVKVLLDGQGADELFAGYHYFFGVYFKELLFNLKFLSLLNETSCYYRAHRSLYGFKAFLFYVLPGYLKRRTRFLGKDHVKRQFFESHYRNRQVSDMSFDAHSLNEALLQHFSYKLEHLLKWEDRNSMWFSLESRVPFLDHRLVERVLSLPSNRLIYRGSAKHIFREAMKGILPEAIRMRRDKIGFSTPEDRWFREPMFKSFIIEILESSSFRKSPYLNYKLCLALYQKHLRGQINISQDIWKWINLELWHRKYIS